MIINSDIDSFQNGDPIPYAETDKDWEEEGNNEEPAWSYYNNDPSNGMIYGKLYNWCAIIDPRGLAPTGWLYPQTKSGQNIPII